MGKPFIALPALIRFLTCVDKQVSSQSAFTHKALITFTALVGLLYPIDPSVASVAKRSSPEMSEMVTIYLYVRLLPAFQVTTVFAPIDLLFYPYF